MQGSSIQLFAARSIKNNNEKIILAAVDLEARNLGLYEPAPEIEAKETWLDATGMFTLHAAQIEDG